MRDPLVVALAPQASPDDAVTRGRPGSGATLAQVFAEQAAFAHRPDGERMWLAEYVSRGRLSAGRGCGTAAMLAGYAAARGGMLRDDPPDVLAGHAALIARWHEGWDLAARDSARRVTHAYCSHPED